MKRIETRLKFLHFGGAKYDSKLTGLISTNQINEGQFPLAPIPTPHSLTTPLITLQLIMIY